MQKNPLEELNHFDFNIIIPKTPESIPLKGSVEEIIMREEVNNWFILKTKFENYLHEEYGLISEQCTKLLKNKLQAKKYWESDIKDQPIGILKAI